MPSFHGASDDPQASLQMRWISIRFCDPSDVRAYARFQRRLHAFVRHSCVPVVLSMRRIGLCTRDPSAARIDELLLVDWLRRQPQLLSVRGSRSPARDTRSSADIATDRRPPSN